MNHPYEWMTPNARRRALWPLTFIALFCMAVLQIINVPLTTDAAPLGIVSYEFAYTLDNARTMLDSWGTAGLLPLGLSLGFDYVFMIAYAWAIGLWVVHVGPRFAKGSRLHTLAPWLAWGMVLAGLLDGVENYALIRLSLDSSSALWPALAAWAAAPKFLLILISLVYVLLGAFRKPQPLN